jgi:HPt (histidine-containing phosphotransfer) domain-containing protein
MVQKSASAVAFTMPGGETCSKARNRPVDLVHLAQQTMGDRALEQEVLGLFVQQALNVRDRIGRAAPAERLQLVHSLKGSARSVGAFAIGEWAAEIEQAPGDRHLIARLGRLIDEVREFIAAIGR